MHRLVPHPDFPPAAVRAISVEVDAARRTWLLSYSVDGAHALALPAPGAGQRTEGLWRTTCFELFVRPAAGEGYFEFNLSPSTDWAAYAFGGYRERMRDLIVPVPRIERTAAGLTSTLDLSGLPAGPGRLGLSAVIDELDGTRSYWALAHPPGKPDFHHPDCFALELPAAV